MVSGTIVDASGRTLSGQTLEAFWTSVRHARPMLVGLNCSLGAKQLREHVVEMSRLADVPLAAYPNAGLPNELGGYDETPDQTVDDAGRVGARGPDQPRRLVLREHARAHGGDRGGGRRGPAAASSRSAPTRPGSPASSRSRSRCPAGVRQHRRADQRDRVAPVRPPDAGRRSGGTATEAEDEAVAIARDQVANGAVMLDVNMDEAMLDGVDAMTRFLRRLGSGAGHRRRPGHGRQLEVVGHRGRPAAAPGPAVVNSISLKEGEDEFLRQAGLCRRYGAAAVVMAFDEAGPGRQRGAPGRRAHARPQAAHRAGRLRPRGHHPRPQHLRDRHGIEEHADYANSFFEATRRLKAALPDARIWGGVSNVSFAFRGNDRVREAIHAVFLYHAIRAGLDMAIVNAGALPQYDDIDPDLLERVEDVVLNRRADATERLLEIAPRYAGEAPERRRTTSPGGRCRSASG